MTSFTSPFPCLYYISLSASPKAENLLNTFNFLYLRLINGFVSIGQMMFTIAEARRKEINQKTSVTIPTLAPKIYLERTRKLICQL